MAEAADYVWLVEQAQFGDRVCLDRLAEMASVRLRAHVFRLTLREDVTADIVQESVLEMIRILGKLKRADRFWPWLYGIALNKLRRYRREERRQKTEPLEPAGYGGASADKQEALEKLLGEELRQMVSRAMEGVRPRHRAALSMRCYDGMSFAEIGASMGTSEFGAQMLFYRAKKSLARQLGRNGLSKGSLLTALVVFGKMTAADEAAAAGLAVSAATLKVGGGAAAAAVAASKTALVTAAAAGAVTVGAIAVNHGGGGAAEGGARPAVTAPLRDEAASRKVSDECWYFFPQGAGGPVMMRQVGHEGGRGESVCRVLQNEYANYAYEGGAVEIRDARAYAADLSVCRLPTDAGDLTAFLDRMEGVTSAGRELEYIDTPRRGLVVIADRQAGVMTGISRVDRHENMLEEEYFQFAWPASCRVADRRDAMHARGWTYFEVEGHVGSAAVHGRGRAPFVYSACGAARPWLDLYVGGVRYVDSRGVATIAGDGETRSYPGGTLMAGLARPWMGLHVIDTVRRDAAAAGVGFVTRRGAEGKMEVELWGGSGSNAGKMPAPQTAGKMPAPQTAGKMPAPQITGKMPVPQQITGKMPVPQQITGKMPAPQTAGKMPAPQMPVPQMPAPQMPVPRVVYTIDLEGDVIEEIRIAGAVEGRMRFRYLQDVEGVGGRFAEPYAGSGVTEEMQGLWLMELGG